MSVFITAPLWGRGFRPFFLLAALSVVGLMGLWGAFWDNLSAPTVFWADPVSWHAHEMLFGYTVAVISGFLLTAVANWTGWSPVRHGHLAGLCAVWLAGRVVMLCPSLPIGVVVAVNALYLPLLTISLLVPLYKSWNARNFVFLFLLFGLWLCELGFFYTQEIWPLHVALMLVCLMISVVGGRIIPAFTVAALRQRGFDVRNVDQPMQDRLAALSLLALGAALADRGLTGQGDGLLAIAGFIAALCHGVRLRHYHVRRGLFDPLVWILQLGYLWLVVGLLLVGLSGFQVVPLSVALHALTAGCLGSLTLGMMARVALAHTGRSFAFPKLTVASFWVLQLAALLRVIGPWADPAHSLAYILGASCLWILAFGLYLVVFTPILRGPRPDGDVP